MAIPKKLPQRLLAIIGCAKSGTSALAAHLGSRPDMKLGRIKEPRYFTHMADVNWTGPGSDRFRQRIISDANSYAENFGELLGEQWAIDASTDYIWRQETPDLLKVFSENSDVRIICVVRDPISRAISEYNHTLRQGWEELKFAAALDAENCRIRDHWVPLFYHQRRSTISEDLERFRGAFGNKLIVIDYVELKDTTALTAKINKFLDLSHQPSGLIERRNESYLPRSKIASQLLKSSSIRAAAKALLPSSLRRTIRESLTVNSRSVETVSLAEIDRFRELMKDEITRCINDPLIPTYSWHNTIHAYGIGS